MFTHEDLITKKTAVTVEQCRTKNKEGTQEQSVSKQEEVIRAANASAQKNYKGKRRTTEFSYGLLPEVC